MSHYHGSKIFGNKRELIGNVGGNANEKGKKKQFYNRKATTLQVHETFWYIS